MKHLAAVVLLLFLSWVLIGCVGAEQHENLKAQRDELQQSLALHKQMLNDAKKDRLRATTALERQERQLQQELSLTRDKLRARDKEFSALASQHEELSDRVFATTEQSLALIEERQQLKATIVELRGTISTLEDTIKDLRQQLSDARVQ